MKQNGTELKLNVIINTLLENLMTNSDIKSDKRKER